MGRFYILKRINSFFLFLNIVLNKTDCDNLRAESSKFHTFELDRLVHSRPVGYKVKLELSIVGEREARIRLAAQHNRNSTSDTEYQVGA